MVGGKYNLFIKSGKQFDFCTRLVRSGQHNSMFVASARTARSVNYKPHLEGIDETTVRPYTQAFIKINLQHCRSLIADKRCLTYSSAFNYATNKGDSYLAIRIGIHVKIQLQNFRLISIPMRSCHAVRAIFHLNGGTLETVVVS